MAVYPTKVPDFLEAHPEWIAEAKAYLQSQYPKEGCGFFGATGFIAMPNLHAEPESAFEMDPDLFINNEVLAIVHSHPDGNDFPSKADMQQQIATAVPWGLAVTTADSCSDFVWFGDQLPPADLLGRPFLYGVFDCYSLIRDWYRINRNVCIPDFPRDWDFWGKNEDMYGEGFAEAGFYEIDVNAEPLQAGDVFFAKVRSEVQNHGGVYVGEGQVLHHVQGVLSRRSSLNPWAAHITKWVRYGGGHAS